MREPIRRLVEMVAATLPADGPILEFGALQVPGQEHLADVRPLFPGRQYIGCDLLEGSGVDRILDLHKIDMPTGSAGTVLILDTLEHVEFPRRAIEEVHRILKPGGFVLITTVLDFVIHAFPCDYWRFTPEGMKSLLSPFSSSFVGWVGRPEFPHTIVGVAFKDLDPPIDDFLREFETWRRSKISLKSAVKAITPPILLPAYREVRLALRTLFASR